MIIRHLKSFAPRFGRFSAPVIIVYFKAETVQDRIDKNGKCGKCPFLEYCMGGCPAMAMLSTADTNPLAPDPLKCFFYENGYYEKFVSALPGWYNLSVMKLNLKE